MFRIGIDWLVTSILLSKGIFNVLLSITLMQSKIILFLLLKESAKLFPNYRKHCTLPGMSHEDKFKNQPSLTVVKDDDLCERKKLGCMEITGLYRRTIIWKGRRISNVQSRILKRAAHWENGSIARCWNKRFTKRVKAILYRRDSNDRLFFLFVNNQRNLDSNLLFSLTKKRWHDFSWVWRNSSQMKVGRQTERLLTIWKSKAL